jgi:hypothetical protein
MRLCVCRLPAGGAACVCPSVNSVQAELQAALDAERRQSQDLREQVERLSSRGAAEQVPAHRLLILLMQLFASGNGATPPPPQRCWDWLSRSLGVVAEIAQLLCVGGAGAWIGPSCGSCAAGRQCRGNG